MALLTTRISPASLGHLGILAALAAYLMVFYPAGRIAVAWLMCAAIASELCPNAWKRWLFGELLLVAAGIASYLLLVDLGDDSFQAWVRMLLAYWLLVPSRPGLLRWALSLAIAELLILGAEPARYCDLPLGRWLGLGRLSLATPLLWLVPIGLTSLALDAWLRGMGNAGHLPRSGNRRLTAWRWAVLPALLVASLLLVLGPALLPLTRRVVPRLGGPAQTGVKRPLIRPGENQWVIKDPTPKARLLWDDPQQPQLQGMAYLRLFTLPQISVEDTLIAWGADDLNHLREVERRFDPSQRFAWVVRRPLGNDAVLRGDGAIGVELADLLGDRHGNRFQTGIDEAPRAYRINLDPPSDQDPELESAWTELPAELDLLPWNRIEDPAWATLDAEAAGEAIRAFLGRHCRYDLDHLPSPAAVPGGVMRTFLFGNDDERRGHCQYFATAAALLLRRLGHPTRCAAGFASDERDDEGYLFRGLHAHAWLEVRERDGTWLRVDPTPVQHLRSEGVDYHDPAGAPVVPGRTEIATLQGDPAALEPPARPWWLALPVFALLAVVLGRIHARPRRDPRHIELDRQSGNLVRFAIQLGVAVAPHTTLSELARQLSERTGIDLSRHLEAHLAARFAKGPLPPPWPLAELRAAARPATRSP